MSGEDELRSRISSALAMHGTASARLNADGSVSVVVPQATNEIAQARERKVNKHKKWHGVTNELIVAHANPDCKQCSGKGFLGDEEDGDVCELKGCAVELFSIAYKGRLRHNAKRNRLEVFV